MKFPVKFDGVGAPSHFVVPKTIISDSPGEAIGKAEAKAYGLCARSVQIFAPGTKNLSLAKPLETRTCDYSAN